MNFSPRFYNALIAHHIQLGRSRGYPDVVLLDDLMAARNYDLGVKYITMVRGFHEISSLHARVKKGAAHIRDLASSFREGELASDDFATLASEVFAEIQEATDDIVAIEAALVTSSPSSAKVNEHG